MLPLRRLLPVLLVAAALPSAAPSQGAVYLTGAGPAAVTAAVERVLLGRSVQGRPIWAYRTGNPSASHVVVVLGQMHGDEPAGVVTARSIRTKAQTATGADVWVVPTMNPDGRSAGTRNNARGVDLNRNWPTNWEPGSTAGSGPASEPETQDAVRALTALVRADRPD